MYDATALKNLMINDNGFGFDPSTGHTYNLSITAMEIVRLLNSGADEEDIMTYLQETFDVEEHRAVHDLDSFFAILCQYGLLTAQPKSEDV